MKLLFTLIIICYAHFGFAQEEVVKIKVDPSYEQGELKHIWAWFGYDEPNYTYMKDGQKLIGEIEKLSPVPVYMRTHNLMTTGDGTAALKWGSTNMYTEDANGNPVYDWTIVDEIFDTYIEHNMKPLAQIGFMPKALSTHPEPYRHQWKPGVRYEEIYTGWSYPPNDYEKWSELIFQWVKHCIDRYGKNEVESWYWELWNEADAPYLMSDDRITEYCKMYDFASDAVKRALPTIAIGGPHNTGGNRGLRFLRSFIEHCLFGVNAVTGNKGAPLDFVGFHAKGSPKVIDGVVRMGMKNQLSDINNNFAVISSFPEIKNIPVIIGESDPEGCAACGMDTNPENAYRNGTMYSSYTAASIARIHDLVQHYNINLIGAVNWSFQFEDQPWFAGFRDLSTNGVNKPVLNVFRMLGMMKGNRIDVSGDNLAYDYKDICESSVRGVQTDVNALASKHDKTIYVLVWNYHDMDIIDEGSVVEITITDIPSTKAKLKHYRIDSEHSNSYEVWKKMGSPQTPTKEQFTTLEKAGKLEQLNPEEQISLTGNKIVYKMKLPRQAVSFIELNY